MAHMIVLYSTPTDPASFDKYYLETHVPLVHKIPNLLKYEISRGPVLSPGGPSPYHLIATLYFEDVATLQQSLSTPEGQAAAADAATFMAPNSQMLFFDNQTV